jgi:thioredoxin-like negative regulator of GroEL
MAILGLVSDADFEVQVEQASGKVLVLFYQSDMDPSTQLLAWLQGKAQGYKGKLKLLAADLDLTAKAAEKYAVFSIPTTLIFERGEVKRIAGNVPDDIQKVLDAGA